MKLDEEQILKIITDTLEERAVKTGEWFERDTTSDSFWTLDGLFNLREIAQRVERAQGE